jgi:hypothetical protein
MGQRVLCQLLEWLPGGFRWVKRRALGQMTKTPGWTAQVEQNDSKGAELRVTVCPYLALCRRYQCAGLCQAFCQNEQWAYGRLRRKVRFVRYETLLEGSCCHMALLNVTGETQQRGKKLPFAGGKGRKFPVSLLQKRAQHGKMKRSERYGRQIAPPSLAPAQEAGRLHGRHRGKCRKQ